MKILIVKMSAIGDVIHTLPALNALREHFPDAHITWLVEEAASDIVKSHQALDRVLISKRQQWIKGLLGPQCLQNIKETIRFVKELRDTVYDLVIDFQGLMKSAAMVGLCRGKQRIGYGMTREFSYIVLDDRIPPFDMDKHAIFRYLNLIKHLGVKARDIEFNIHLGEQERSRVMSMLRQDGWDKQSVVAINPVAKWDSKLWGDDNFSRLADKLVSELGCLVVFTGSKQDKKEIAKIISRMHNPCIDFSGRTDLRHLAALYGMSKCLVSTDTGPMHLSAAVGTPVVALFGPTAPWRTGPFGDGHEIIRSDLSCSPCFKKKCDSVECMKLISVEQVLASIRRIWDRSSDA